ncbi:hypothetical protein [Pelagibius sp. Alg239-R121]|uniref:hypothetical protein n=1 Tax=Pelagibius sp. Alg239-R121 TaxID=2993448 RepID=UPI0024A64BE2|nr:hypothetical protein [Pelagibius sp. Alg239-R121]
MRNLHLVAASATFLLTSTPAYAASQDECAIWLCLPGGFPSGCGAAYSAFIERITHKPKPKPPLPPFNSCAVDSGNIGFDWGFEEKKRCKNPEAKMLKGQEGTLSCRVPSNNEDGFLASPVVTDHVLWTDVPSLGKDYRKTEYVWKTTGGAREEGGRP